jgi:hypothetical protein
VRGVFFVKLWSLFHKRREGREKRTSQKTCLNVLAKTPGVRGTPACLIIVSENGLPDHIDDPVFLCRISLERRVRSRQCGNIKAADRKPNCDVFDVQAPLLGKGE